MKSEDGPSDETVTGIRVNMSFLRQIYQIYNLMDFLTNLLDSSSMPWVTAFLLGLMTAISPCPLATNITAVGFISKDLEDRNRVFFNGLLYTLGRAVTYTVIPLIIFLGADQFRFSGFFQRYGEKIHRSLLIINRNIHA